MPLKENFTYEITNTQVTDSGEGRISVCLKYDISKEVEGNLVTDSIVIGNFSFGVGVENPSTANVESLLKTAVPQYFTE